MQKGIDLFAHAEFNSAFNHFLEHGNSGLMLVSVPTGVGKTTQAKLYICNHYSEKTFFYVTPLNKNVKKAFEDELKKKHPDNNFIKDKIRQQLQYLRDKGFIEFVTPGHYKKI